tara:strand:- start:1456 stop:1998 length:543 start_codon:yes stop_codon:yes gene_type:complete
LTAKDFVLMSTFASLTSVLGMFPPIPIPLIPVPITAQTFGVMMAGCLLRPKLALCSMFLFILLVAAGFPILAGGRGGMAAFTGPSSGFLLSWPFASYIISRLNRKLAPSIVTFLIANIVGGLIFIYTCGIMFMVMVFNISTFTAMSGAAIFLPGDILKAVIASGVAARVIRANVVSRHDR